VVGRKNKPSEMREKRTIYRCHLEKRFGAMRLASVRINNILAVLVAGQ
jgi:hypothetical protein